MNSTRGPMDNIHHCLQNTKVTVFIQNPNKLPWCLSIGLEIQISIQSDVLRKNTAGHHISAFLAPSKDDNMWPKHTWWHFGVPGSISRFIMTINHVHVSTRSFGDFCFCLLVYICYLGYLRRNCMYYINSMNLKTSEKCQVLNEGGIKYHQVHAGETNNPMQRESGSSLTHVHRVDSVVVWETAAPTNLYQTFSSWHSPMTQCGEWSEAAGRRWRGRTLLRLSRLRMPASPPWSGASLVLLSSPLRPLLLEAQGVWGTGQPTEKSTESAPRSTTADGAGTVAGLVWARTLSAPVPVLSDSNPRFPP